MPYISTCFNLIKDHQTTFGAAINVLVTSAVDAGFDQGLSLKD